MEEITVQTVKTLV